jgi:hypothetical protein
MELGAFKARGELGHGTSAARRGLVKRVVIRNTQYDAVQVEEGKGRQKHSIFFFGRKPFGQG